MSKLKGFAGACALVLMISTLFAGANVTKAYAGGVVFFVDATHGWESTYHGDGLHLSTPDAYAWHTTDGGWNWKKVGARTPAFNGGGAWGGFFAFATRSTGIWVRAGRTVLRTTNAGTSWHSVGYVARTWLNDAEFATSRVGWACSQVGSDGSGGSIAKTTDAGRTWHVQKRLATAPGNRFDQVSCPTSTRCYVLGSGSMLGRLWATADGGKHWARRPLPSGYWYAMDFPTATTGWLVGGDGAMVTTTDGGVTWQYVDSGAGDNLTSVSFCNSQVGFAAGASGTLVRTTDGGATWTSLDADYGVYLRSVQCVDPKHAWILDEYDGLYSTDDGGSTWRDVSVFPD
jgi:photosystem II stability/assembly factor-like uncharacterized protein